MTPCLDSHSKTEPKLDMSQQEMEFDVMERLCGIVHAYMWKKNTNFRQRQLNHYNIGGRVGGRIIGPLDRSCITHFKEGRQLMHEEEKNAAVQHFCPALSERALNQYFKMSVCVCVCVCVSPNSMPLIGQTTKHIVEQLNARV